MQLIGVSEVTILRTACFGKAFTHGWYRRRLTPSRLILLPAMTSYAQRHPCFTSSKRLSARLQAIGVSPETVDFVLLTHLHADHVGWNTRLQGERWVPTFPMPATSFPNANIATIWRFPRAGGGGKIQRQAGLGTPRRHPLGGVFEDSVMPIVEAGLDQRIKVDNTLIEGFRFHSTPGHSIDHASISVTSRGETALFWGDIMHHPLQFRRPETNSVYCEFPEAAQQSRHKAMQLAAELDALVFTTHFGDSSVGKVSRQSHSFNWQFIQGTRS